jgi:hypothetical protein
MTGRWIAPEQTMSDLSMHEWDGDRLIIISAFWDANLQAKRLGLA